MSLRCFIAIPIDKLIEKQISDLVFDLKKYDADIKWVKPGGIHVTLKFLGNTQESMIPKIKDTLVRAVSSFDPFSITICGIGAFPDDKRPRVFWVGIHKKDSLEKLHSEIEARMSQLGYTKEKRSFHPHITLGRVRSQKGVKTVTGKLDLSRDIKFGESYIDKLELMKSDLKPAGAEYTCLHAISL
jgi:2'-5' RNA ligase